MSGTVYYTKNYAKFINKLNSVASRRLKGNGINYAAFEVHRDKLSVSFKAKAASEKGITLGYACDKIRELDKAPEVALLKASSTLMQQVKIAKQNKAKQEAAVTQVQAVFRGYSLRKSPTGAAAADGFVVL